MFDAKTNLSRYVALVESGEADRVVLCRKDKPVAQIDPYRGGGFTVGLLEGKLEVGDLDASNDMIAEMFYGA